MHIQKNVSRLAAGKKIATAAVAAVSQPTEEKVPCYKLWKII